MLESLASELRLSCGRKLPCGVFLAPMEGVMAPAFVEAASALGLLDVWMPPFVSVPAGAVPSKAALRRRLANFDASGLPVVPQILGKDPEAVASCAGRLAALGYEFISLNFACPSPVVLRSGSGGAMLKKPELLLRTLQLALEAVDGKASLIVKLRTGWSSPKECESLLPAIREAGAGACILHFRTVEEKYNIVEGGLARLANAVELSWPMPVIGNGDIRSVSDAERMLCETECAGLAIARGFLSDPFLLRRLLGKDSPSLDEGRKLFLAALQAQKTKAVKGNVLEVAKEMYGERSESFKALLGR